MEKEFPMLANKALNIGVSTSGAATFSGLMGTNNVREFTTEEKERTKTCVRVELPFALTGMYGSYRIGNTTSFEVRLLQRPVQVAAHNIGLPNTNELVKNLKLEPDNWGYVNYTELTMINSSWKTVVPPTGKSIPDFAKEVLSAITGTINPFLDWYSLAKENYSIGRVSARDFVRFEMWHVLDENYSEWFNHTAYYFPESSLSFESLEQEGDSELKAAVLRFGKNDDAYNLGYRLFAEANRAVVRGDHRLASIQAISGLEAAVFHYMQARAPEKKDDQEFQRISKNAYDEVEDDLRLSLALRILVPMLIPDDITYPKADFDACNRLRKKRNTAIHEPHKFEKKGVEDDLPAIKRAIDFLVRHHPVEAE